VLAEPGRASTTRELLNTAALLASEARGWVCAIGQAGDVDPATLASWGADEVIELHGSDGEEDVAQSISTYAEQTGPWAILAPSTAWGRHVAGRTAAWLGAGLTGDAVSVEAAGRRLVAWKPAFGGQLLAAIESRSPIQLVTVRPGALPVHADRRGVAPHVTPRRVASRGRVVVASRTRDDDLEVLATADHVVGVGLGVDPADYDLLQPLVAVLGAELGATRKVTDRGWLPRSRQIGITGRCVAPKLYVAVGISGRLNHTVGVRQAGTILAINADPDAEIIEHCDVAILADWRAVAPLLAIRIGQVHRPASRPMPI
jgi:electron transfer flavoprotein alpha subunit